MAGQKVRVEKSQINLPTLTEFTESFIYGCYPSLMFPALLNPVLLKFLMIQFHLPHNKLIQYKSKQYTSQNQHFGLTEGMAKLFRQDLTKFTRENAERRFIFMS